MFRLYGKRYEVKKNSGDRNIAAIFYIQNTTK